MDLASPEYFQAPLLFSNGEPAMESNDNPFSDTFSDPLCKLNLKETSEFVKSFPMSGLDVSTQRRRVGVYSDTTKRGVYEAPSTPGRPVFSFSGGGGGRKSFPSKWDDAEKWLISSSSSHDSPALAIRPPPAQSSKVAKQSDNFKQGQFFSEKSRVTEENVSKVVSSFKGSVSLGHHGSVDVFLKDKFTDEIEPILPDFRCSEPSREGFLFQNSASETMKDAGTDVFHEVKHKDAGTEMTPLGSSMTSRCHTPCKSSSPVRHNTPANRSGPLNSADSNSSNSTIDILQMQECHLAKLQLVRAGEVFRIRELLHGKKRKGLNVPKRGSKNPSLGEPSKCKSRSSIKKARGENPKDEIKTRGEINERMMIVHRKAEEWRASAQQQHTEQMQKPNNAPTINQSNSNFSGNISCGCLPCNNRY
ncbi:Proteasome subunit alpha type-5-A isoform 1 [Hibiscus syriacus]|uniref:Proteasome subunit alpha type-5-A isoform 1 n=1 Tax=Hibiscus syriacus TaxID=106335 RepID=A0A6A3AX47_HIBSY|nr:Proteasome subunit alpha type-5-A isoform 1 [Hibiscus syriacus]